MFSQIVVGVSDFERAVGFHLAVMSILGCEQYFLDRSVPWAAWKMPGKARPLFVIGAPYDGKAHAPGNGQMTAFLASSRDQVRQVYEMALAQGGTDEGAPGLRPHYHPHYYGAYYRDTEGNKFCIVCHDPEG